MAINAAHWTIDRANGNIRYTGNDHFGAAPSYATVIEFHRWLGELADDAVSSGDDELDITDELPSARSTDNIITLLGNYNIDQTASEHLYDGTIIQGAVGVDRIVYDGIVNFGNPQVQIQIHQDGAVLADDWWNYAVGGSHTGAADASVLTDSTKSWTTNEHVGRVIKNTTDGSWGIVTANTATTITATLAGGTEDDWDNGDTYLLGVGLNANASQGISHRFMLKVHDFVAEGGDIDGRRLLGTSRTLGKTFSEFGINGTSNGNNVLALSDTDDLNNASAYDTIAGWTGITNTTVGYNTIDVNNDGTPEPYYSEWNANLSTRTINDFYERMKFLTMDGQATTLYGLAGELFRGITHEIPIDTNTGTFVEPEQVSWGTGATAGVGQLLAIDSVTAGTKMWIQLLSGVIPTDGLTITGVSTATCAVNGSVTARPVSVPFIGASTGSAIIGAYGVGIETNDLKNTDKVTDLDGTLRLPPNNVTFTVGGLIADEDQVIVGPWDGSTLDNEGNPAIQTAQLGTGLTVALTTDNITTVTVGAANIPTDTPSTGYIRVVDDLGFSRRLHYTAWENTGGTFTVDTTDGQEDFLGNEAAIGNDVWISYIDDIADSTPVTAGSFTIGVEYIIVTTGTTDFTLIGAGDSNPGTIFTATGVGTGTGTAKPRSTSLAFTGVYDVDRDLVVVVRDGKTTPIKQFISAAVFGSSDTTITAIRTTDE